MIVIISVNGKWRPSMADFIVSVVKIGLDPGQCRNIVEEISRVTGKTDFML